MSGRFLEVKIMPMAMHNVPLLTVRLRTSDLNTNRANFALPHCSSPKPTTLATCFLLLIVP